MVEIEDIGVVNIGNISKVKYIDKRLYEVLEEDRVGLRPSTSEAREKKRNRVRELRFRRRFQIWDI